MFLTVIVIHAFLIRFNDPVFGLGEWLRIWINLLCGYAGVGIIALGMTFVITCGGVDLSSGASAAAVSAVLVLFLDTGGQGVMQALGISGIPAYTGAICAGLLFGALLGFVTGSLVTRGNIPPFITTLGAMMLYRGLTRQAMAGLTPAIPAGFSQISLWETGGGTYLPILYWMVLAALFYVLLNRTVFGKYVRAVGSGEKAAWLAGININRIKRIAYMLAGITAAAAAVIQVSAYGVPDYGSVGSGYATDAITACILGGVRLGGGQGYMAGAVMGTLIVAVINSMPGLTNGSPYVSEACKGIVIIGAMLLQKQKSIKINV